MQGSAAIALVWLAVGHVVIAAADDDIAMSGPHRTPFDDRCAARRADDVRCIPLVTGTDAGLYAIVDDSGTSRTSEYYVALHTREGWWTSSEHVWFDLMGSALWTIGSYVAIVDTPVFAFARSPLAFATISQGIGYQFKPDYFAHRRRPTERTTFVGDGIACGVVSGSAAPVCAHVHLQCDHGVPLWNSRSDRITGTCPRDSDPEHTRTATLAAP
jgi:hypothetical protein